MRVEEGRVASDGHGRILQPENKAHDRTTFSVPTATLVIQRHRGRLMTHAPPALSLPRRSGRRRRVAGVAWQAARLAGRRWPPPSPGCRPCATSRRRSGRWRSLLREYPISSAEGLALMRLAEALLRVPDAETAIALTADQLGRADFVTAPTAAHTACWPACRPAPSRCPRSSCPTAKPSAGLLQAPGRADGGGRHGARDPAAGPPVRARPPHRRGDGRSRSARARAADAALQLRHAGRRRAHRADALRYLASYQNAIAAIATAARAATAPEHSRRHLDQAQRAALALRRRAARARVRRAGAARLDA